MPPLGAEKEGEVKVERVVLGGQGNIHGAYLPFNARVVGLRDADHA